MTVSLNFNIPYVKEQNQESISAWLVLSPLALTNNQKKKKERKTHTKAFHSLRRCLLSKV